MTGQSRLKRSKVMRLQKVQDELKEKGWEYRYTEEAGLGSIVFEYQGGSAIISGNLMRMVWERKVISVLQEEQRILLVRIMKNRLCSW